MIPKNEAEAIVELQKVLAMHRQLMKSLGNLALDTRYPSADRNAATAIREFCEVQEDIVNNVVTGLATFGLNKGPTQTGAIISALTKK